MAQDFENFPWYMVHLLTSYYLLLERGLGRLGRVKNRGVSETADQARFAGEVRFFEFPILGPNFWVQKSKVPMYH